MKLIISLILVLCVGCSSYEPNDADRGALAGAVVGGGVGAALGSQAGSAVGGLALGSITGAGVGAMIGHRFQEKDDVIDTQAETIQQQQRQLQMHRNEVDQLRRSTQDQVAFSGQRQVVPMVAERDLKASFPTTPTVNHLAASKITDSSFHSSPPAEPSEPVDQFVTEEVAPVIAKDLTPPAPQELPAVQPIQEMDSRAAYNWNQEETSTTTSPECQEAKKEITSAGQAQITAEKLYHFRRAQRLCPEDVSVHAGLGKVYLELDRKDDARHEFQEALKREPGNQEVKDLMNKL